MKKLILLVAILLIILGGYWLLNRSHEEQTGLLQVEAPTGAAVVKIKNFAFEPATINIKKGETVKWINEDGAPHTVTSNSGGLLNSSILKTGESFIFTFSSLVAEDYHCEIHPTMKARVVVEE